MRPPTAVIPSPIRPLNQHSRHNQTETPLPGTRNKTLGHHGSTLTRSLWGWMHRVDPFLSLQPLSPPCSTKPVLRRLNHKLGPPNLASLQTSRAKAATSQGNQEIQANPHHFSTLWSVEWDLSLHSLPTPSAKDNSLPLMTLEMGVDPNLVVVLQYGPSYFVPCSEANHPKKRRILSAQRHSSRAWNVSQSG